jgi:hypothetical protein
MRVYDGSQWIAASAASQAILTKYKYVATAGQTTFSGTDANSLTLAYTVGSIIVTLNGVVLNGADYTATSGTSVVLGVAASLNDELNILSFSTFDVANTYTQSQIDAFAVKLTGDQTVAGVKTFSGATTVMNGNVGIGTASPSQRIHVSAADPRALLASTGTGHSAWQCQNTSGSSYFGRDNAGGSFFGTANSTVVYSSSADPIIFYTGATERARITDGGNWLVGTTSNIGSGRVGIYRASLVSNGDCLALQDGDSATGGAFISFKNQSATNIGTISRNGASTVAYNTSSDYRLKEDIAPMTGALSVVQQLSPVTYTWKEDGESGQGFIAHELQAVVPECVTGQKDAVDADGNPVYQGIDTSFLVATLTAAIQELKTIVDAQATRITALEQA